jgi:hypothetical protein
MVDVHPDPRLANDERSNPAGSRRSEMREEAVFAKTQRNDIRRRTDNRVGPEIVMRRRDGEGRGGPVRRQDRGDLGRRYARNVAGHRHHACPALASEQARGGGDSAGMAFARAFGDDARAVAAGERGRDRIERYEKEAGKLRDRAQGLEDILEHDGRKRATFLRVEA